MNAFQYVRATAVLVRDALNQSWNGKGDARAQGPPFDCDDHTSYVATLYLVALGHAICRIARSNLAKYMHNMSERNSEERSFAQCA